MLKSSSSLVFHADLYEEIHQLHFCRSFGHLPSSQSPKTCRESGIHLVVSFMCISDVVYSGTRSELFQVIIVTSGLTGSIVPAERATQNLNMVDLNCILILDQSHIDVKFVYCTFWLFPCSKSVSVDGDCPFANVRWMLYLLFVLSTSRWHHRIALRTHSSYNKRTVER